MTARIIDGKARAQRLTAEVRAQVAARVAAGKAPPGLAVVLVGDNPASQVYVRNKRRTTEAAGMRSFAHDLPASTSQADLLALIDTLNRDPAVTGILVQLPLPKHIDDALVTERIDPLQGRRRLPSVQHRAAGAEAPDAAAVHALRLHDAAEGHRRGSRRQARGRDRAVEHRRPADGARAPDGALHGDDLPFEDARPSRARAAGGHRRRRRRQGRISCRATG